jgi:hypothetical protein
MNDGLSLADCTAAAEKRRGDYQLVLGILMAVDVLMGLALLICPGAVARLLDAGDPGSVEWARVAGILTLILVTMLWTGWNHPNRSKLVNVVGIVGRFLLGLALVLIGGSLLWVGLFEIVASLVLARFYYRFFAALVMSRP